MPLLTEPTLTVDTFARRFQPELRMDGLVLRPWRAGDAATVVAAFDDPDIRRWHVRSMASPEEAREWIGAWAGRWTSGTDAGWAITADAKVVGQIALRRIERHEAHADLSYWVLPSARGQAVATRALQNLTTWAFTDLGLHRLEILHSTLNPASCRVAVKAGYPLEGTKRGDALHTDGWHDMHLHARLADDPAQAVS